MGPGEGDGRDVRELHVFPGHPLTEQDAACDIGAADSTGAAGSGTPASSSLQRQPRRRGVCHCPVCQGGLLEKREGEG